MEVIMGEEDKVELKEVYPVHERVRKISYIKSREEYEKLQWADGLPKTRSGKIMRRILKKVAANDVGDLGDTSTLADPSVVEDLVRNRL
jgi:acyl-coenzyme A synthetase/AMP-(fatty) acid ligase